MSNFQRPESKELYAKDLILSKTNPRFPKPVSTEKEAILTFFKLKKVGPHKIEAIIRDILENRTVMNDFIVLEKDNQFVVHDGNRRLTALKLFINDNIDIIKDDFPSTYNFVKEVKKEFDISELPLFVKVYTDANSMAEHVLKIHSGEQGGVGQISWESNEKDTFASQFLDRPMTLGNKIYKKLEETPSLKNLYEKIKDKGFTTTFDRIFNYLDIKSRIFKLDRGLYVDIDNEAHLKKVIEMINFFLSKEATVSDVYSKKQAITFFSSIPPVGPSDTSLESDTTNSGLEEKEEEPKSEVINEDKDKGKSINIESKGDQKKLKNNSSKLAIQLELIRKTITLNRYESYDLTHTIKKALDSSGNDISSYISFHSDNQDLINGNIFSGDAKIGCYNVQVKLNYQDTEVSRGLTINIITPKATLTIPTTTNTLFTSVSALTLADKVTIDINNTVNGLIDEMQKIKKPENYPLLITSCTRQLVELSVNKLYHQKNLKNHGNTKNNLINLIQTIEKDTTLLRNICDGQNKLKFMAMKNFLGSIDGGELYDYLNLITHDSMNAIYSDLEEKINKQITPLLLVINNYLKLP